MVPHLKQEELVISSNQMFYLNCLMTNSLSPDPAFWPVPVQSPVASLVNTLYRVTALPPSGWEGQEREWEEGWEEVTDSTGGTGTTDIMKERLSLKDVCSWQILKLGSLQLRPLYCIRLLSNLSYPSNTSHWLKCKLIYLRCLSWLKRKMNN